MAATAAFGPVPVDAVDSRLAFQGSWKTGADDPNRNDYHNGTYQISSKNGDFVAFDWTGGDLTIVGSTKPNHGFYSISLDSASKQYYDGYAAVPVNRAILWASKGLSVGAHRIELRNENVYMQSAATQDRLILDVDYMSYIPVAPVAPPVQQSSSTTQSPAASSAVVASSTSASPQSTSSTVAGSSTSSPSSTFQTRPFGAVSTLPSTSLSASPTSFNASRPQETFEMAIKMVITTGTPRLPASLPAADSVRSAAAGTLPIPGIFLIILLLSSSSLAVRRGR